MTDDIDEFFVISHNSIIVLHFGLFPTLLIFLQIYHLFVFLDFDIKLTLHVTERYTLSQSDLLLHLTLTPLYSLFFLPRLHRYTDSFFYQLSRTIHFCPPLSPSNVHMQLVQFFSPAICARLSTAAFQHLIIVHQKTRPSVMLSTPCTLNSQRAE